MRLRRGLLGLLILIVGMMTLAPLSAGTASAAPPGQATNTYRAVPISGTLDNGNLFVGTFNLQNFAAQNGQLVATGTVSGFLTDAAGNVLQTIDPTAATLPAQVSGTCAILHLTLGPLDLNLLGLVVHLNQVVLNIDAQSGPGQLLGNLLCAVAHLLDHGSPLAGLVALLNNILGQLFPSVPIAGAGATGGFFAGALTLQNVAAQNNALAANGLLSGNLVNGAGVQPVAAQPVTGIPLLASGTCPILHLDLGPLDLNLLGLQVHLNEVVLDITAQQGGGLLGNLLCAVANLLNGGGPLSQIAALLNQILALL
jgi:hypothetical protein